MGKRIAVAAVGVPLVAAVILLAPAWATGLAMGLVAACCAWEFLRCTEPETPRRVHVYAAAAAFAIPALWGFLESRDWVLAVEFALLALLLGELMASFRRKTTMEFESVTVTLLAGGVLPLMLGTVALLRRREPGQLYALLPFLIAFSCDGAAYFAGRALGRHRLAPRISPNKTLEGSLGGFLGAVGVALLYGLVLRWCGWQVKLPVLAATAFLGALFDQLGDLSFSAVKRLYGLKDYGSVLPGHGGMMDRFDSMVWTAPLVYFLCMVVPPIAAG